MNNTESQIKQAQTDYLKFASQSPMKSLFPDFSQKEVDDLIIAAGNVSSAPEKKRGHLASLANTADKYNQANNSNYIIAIDGPTASGKGTIAKRIAKHFGIPCLDTGAIYRAITIYFTDNKIPATNLDQITKLISKINLDVVPTKSGETRITIDGIDVTERLHLASTSEKVAHYACLPIIRERAKAIQKQIASNKSIVCEGRDIASVVFPNAKYKVFLTSSLEVRAKRRHAQEIAKGETTTLAQVTKGIADRDHLDMTRPISPLIHVKDAELIDSSNLDVKQTVDLFVRYIENKNKQDQKASNIRKPFFKALRKDEFQKHLGNTPENYFNNLLTDLNPIKSSLKTTREITD